MATFTRRPSSSTTDRRRTAAETVDMMEGEKGGGSSTETGSRESVDLDTYIDGVIANDQDDSETASEEDERPRAGKGKERAEPSKVVWSDDEDNEATYKAFQQRRTLKRKRAAAVTRQVKAKTNAKASSMVGRKSRPKLAFDQDKEDKKTQRQKRAYGTDDDEDRQGLGDETLPDYVKNRKTKFEQNREKMGDAGLTLPPAYDGIEFSDDERLEYLKERPAFPSRKPIRAYEDVVLETSAGIIPAAQAQWLRDYQIQGAEFLHEKFVYQKGGILGDDMGLDKSRHLAELV